jgi:hypothetical protein
LQNHGKLWGFAKFVLDDMAGDFFRQREWETHNYLTEAIWVGISGANAGALVGASFFSRPGRKKVAGETLWLALMPEHPVLASTSVASTAKPRKLQFNLTCRV